MVYKLNGEQPFQVLSSDFSISPSESGYELYFSADGFNYTSFATVGAGVTRQFVQMNAGNYYKLMGNTGEVSVNWERDCCGGGSGSGAGVSSLNGQTGALTTKTINGNDILGSGDITIEGGSSKQDYIIVDALSAITEPYEGMMAFVKGNIAVDRLANVSCYKLAGWAGGMAQFVDGEDYTIYRGITGEKWQFPYREGSPAIDYYWIELNPGVYVRYQGGNLWVAWNSENYPSATMLGNNFTDSDHKWGETSGQTFYITLEHSEGFNQYRDGKWVPMKKQYWFQDCLSSSALTEEICHRTAEGEMDITLIENDGVMTCQYSAPNNWNVGSTAFIMLMVDTNSNNLQYFRKFVNWDSYEWAQDISYSKHIVSENPTVKYLTEDTWTGAYWEIGTVVPDGGVWGASIRRPDNTEIFETYHLQNEVEVMGEGNIASTGSIEGNLKITDENEHIMLDGQGNRYVFRMDFSNGRLYFYHSPEQVGNFVYEGAQGAQHTTGETSGTVHIELAKVLSGDSWVQKDEMLFPKSYFIDNMTTEERVALYNLIRYSGPKVSPISKFCRFFSQITDKDGFMGMCEVYFCRFDTNLSFSGNAMSRNSDALIKVSFNLTSDGNIDGKTVTEYSLSEKVVSLSQSDYDALVQAGTVDANTLYVII